MGWKILACSDFDYGSDRPRIRADSAACEGHTDLQVRAVVCSVFGNWNSEG